MFPIVRGCAPLVDAGIDGFMHLVRDEVMDDELIAKMKAKNVCACRTWENRVERR